jgi:NAD-dependent DNA ligase
MANWEANRFGLDDHGQPANESVNEAAVVRRAINELIGLSKGILADGVVNEHEANNLASWCYAHRHIASEWPISEAVQIFNSNYGQKPTQQWLNELAGFLQTLASMPNPEENTPSTLPLSRPVPNVIIPGRTFLFTGKFQFGTRTMCQLAVEERGGRCAETVNKSVDFLVIGDLASRDWAHSAFGRKILRAVELSRTTQIKLIDEATFASAVDRWPVEVKAAPPPRWIPADVRISGIDFEPPETAVTFSDRRFFLLGTFQDERTPQDIKRLGGKVIATLRPDIDYMVVGAATPDRFARESPPAFLKRAHLFAADRLRIITENHLHRFRAGLDRGR